MFRFLLVLSTIILSGFSFATSLQPLQVAGYDYQAKVFPVQLYVDHSNALTIHDISRLDFSQNVVSSRFNVPVERANYWFAFQVHNQSKASIKRIVKFDEPFLYQADLYYKLDGNKWFRERNGLDVPMVERGIKNRLPSFSINLAPGEIKTLYLMMNTKQNLLTVGLEVKSLHEFTVDEQFETAAYWLFFGMSFTMLIYNLFLLMSLRDKLYLYYALYCVTFLAFAVMYSGFDLYLISSANLHYLLAVSISISVACLAQFMRVLLQTKVNLPKIDLCLLFIIVVFSLQGLLTAINIHYYYFVIYIGMPTTLFLFLVSFYAYKKNIALANYALFGLSWHILGLFAVAGVNSGFLSFNIFTRYGFMVGSLVELLVFSLALAYRIHYLQAKQIATQSALYHSETQAKLQLEKEVKARTLDLVNVNKKLELLSQEDALTGLFNRRHFDAMLAKEWARMQRSKHSLCIILIDIDFFKQFNDTYGHPAGDQCLRLTCEVIKKSLGRSSDIAARYGGEEFVIILPESSAEEGWQVSYKIKQALKEKRINHKHNPEGLVTMSFGIAAIVPNEKISSESLIEQADLALYKSKNNGRDRISTFQIEL